MKLHSMDVHSNIDLQKLKNYNLSKVVITARMLQTFG